jgi:hemerythrin-like domain-containing protein
MSLLQATDDSRINHRQHGVLRLEVQNLRVALDSLGAYSEAIANLRSLHEVAEHLHLLLSDIPAHFVHEEQTVLNAMERLGPEEARFAGTMREQHRMLNNGLAQLFRRLNEIHDSNDLRASLRELQECGEHFANLLVHHMNTEDRKLQSAAESRESTVAHS